MDSEFPSAALGIAAEIARAHAGLADVDVELLADLDVGLCCDRAAEGADAVAQKVHTGIFGFCDSLIL